tara:strand:+ start:262 stop:672 length:411 start_codon:yes stop_codon:yes gene_type:complete
VARVLAIDYGAKRVGFAVTDALKIIASPLETVENSKALGFLENYLKQEYVETIVVGQPTRWDGSFSDIETEIKKFVNDIKKWGVNVVRYNEMFTSKIARQSFVESGLKKKKREDKSLLDSTSATIILQDYLSSQGL